MGADIGPSAIGVVGNLRGEDNQDSFTGTLLGLRELKAAFRRRRRFLLLTALTGLLIGAAMHVVLPKSYKAVSNLYLIEPTGSTPADAMANEVSLLQTRAVAQQAAGNLPGHPSAQTVAAAYKGQAVSGSILSLSATARSPAQAVVLNTAVARAFLAVRSDELRRETDVVIAGLQAQLGALEGHSNSEQLQRAQLLSSESSAELTLQSSVDGSFVLDPAATIKAPTKKVTIVDMMSGLVAGLALGSGTTVAKEMLSDRARRREEIAEALGVAVELSLAPRGLRFWRGRRRRGILQEGPTAMIARRLRAHLDAVSGRSLAVFSIEADEEAADALCALASALALEGETVFVVDTAEGRPVLRHFSLQRGSDPVQTVPLDDGSLTVLNAPADPAQVVDTVVRVRTDYVLALANVDPAFGVEHVAAWASDGVAIVTAGKATRVRLVGIGRMIRRAGIALRSSIVIGADPGDDSVGLLDSEPSRPEGRRAINTISAG